MRRDVLLSNASGALGVVCGCAVDEILEDRGRDDAQFVRRHHAILLERETPGDIVVRIVADEPLLGDESEQWVARVRSHLDVADGRVLVTDGLDADLLNRWQSAHGLDADGDGVAVVQVEIGLWDVDILTYAPLSGDRGNIQALVHIHQRVEGDDDLPAGLMFDARTGARTLPTTYEGIAARFD